MGLYLLNISVDTPDPNPDYIPENLLINDQESIIEIVVEKILGYEDAIKEYDDNDKEDHNKNTYVKIDLIAQYHDGLSIIPSFNYTTRQKFTDPSIYLTNGFTKLDTPPPKI